MALSFNSFGSLFYLLKQTISHTHTHTPLCSSNFFEYSALVKIIIWQRLTNHLYLCELISICAIVLMEQFAFPLILTQFSICYSQDGLQFLYSIKLSPGSWTFILPGNTSLTSNHDVNLSSNVTSSGKLLTPSQVPWSHISLCHADFYNDISEIDSYLSFPLTFGALCSKEQSTEWSAERTRSGSTDSCLWTKVRYILS